MIKIQHVDPNYIHQIWPLVEPWLIPVFKKSTASKYYDIEHLKYMIIRGEQILLVGTNEEGEVQGVATIQWLNFPKARVAYITTMGGKLITSKENHEKLINWVCAHGGTRIEGSVRESVARLCKQKAGYTAGQINVEFEL